MEKLKLNNTPVRTARNFAINNIEVLFEMPKEIRKFKNVEIINDKSIIDNEVSNKELTYGTGKILEKLIFEEANNKIRIQTTKQKEDIKIIYNFDDNNLNLINQIEIIANNDTNVTIIYKSKTSRTCFHNGIVRTTAKENVQLNVTIVNMLNENTDNFEAIENTLYQNSNVKYTIIDIGGKTSVSNYYSNIIGTNASNDLKTIYLGRNNQIKDINYIAELKGEKTNIDIDVQGALKDEAKKNFKGTIDFKTGSKKAKGKENEYCTLLSDASYSKALPMLLCTEDDVEGEHSTATGKVDDNELFYIMTRGISEKEAKKMIVKAKFNSVIQGIKEETVQNLILEEVDRRLD